MDVHHENVLDVQSLALLQFFIYIPKVCRVAL